MDVENLYVRYGPMVLRRCRTLLRDEERALDAMQETFVLLLRNASRLHEGSPSSLLLRMATNVCLNALRSASRRPEDPIDELVQGIAKAADAESRSLAGLILSRLFSRTPESSRAIAVMHLVDGMTLEEVAREVGMSVSGVRKRLRNLQEALGQMQEAA